MQGWDSLFDSIQWGGGEMTLLEMIKDECGGLSIREMMVVRAVVGIFAGAV